MCVVSIDSKMPFKFRALRVYERVPDGAKFLASAALVHWGPALLYCSITGEMLPFYLMTCNQALGVALGVLRYKKQPGEFLSCAPLGLVPNVPSGPQIYEMRKAA